MRYPITVYREGATEWQCSKAADIDKIWLVPDGRLTSLIPVITKQPWSAGTFKENERGIDNFIACDFIAIDIDKDCSLDKFKNDLANQYSHVIYLTRTHGRPKGDKPACDRFRVVFKLQRTIRTAAEYEITWKMLKKRFPYIDEVAKDPSRFFFPGALYSVYDPEQEACVPVARVWSSATDDFLEGRVSSGGRNDALFRAAIELRKNAFTLEDACNLFFECWEKHPNYADVDWTSDWLKTIESAFSPSRPVEVNPTIGSFLDTPDEISLDEACKILIDPYFVKFRSPMETIIYKITSPRLGEVTECPNLDEVRAVVLPQLWRLPEEVRERLSFAKLIAHWRSNQTNLDSVPPAVGWLSEYNYVFKRLPFEPIPGNFSAWQQFVSRLSDPDAYMMFVWSLFDLKSTSRQALWLFDEQGQTGKSTTLRVLWKCFGRASASIDNNDMKESRFALASLVGKRLVTYADCNNTRILMSEIFKAVVSRDPVRIEVKGKQPVSSVLNAKLMIASNRKPEFTGERAHLSRLILISVSENISNKDDPDWEQSLEAELPSFLHACREMYLARVPKGGQIPISQATIDDLESVVDNFGEANQAILDNNFDLNAQAEIPANDFFSILSNNIGLSTNQIGDFKHFLSQAHNIRRQQRKIKGQKHYFYEGIEVKKNKAGLRVVNLHDQNNEPKQGG